MARRESFGHIVSDIMSGVIGKISGAVENREKDKGIILPNVNHGLRNWIEKASELSDVELDEAPDGWVVIEIPDLMVKVRSLATDVRIIKKHSSASQADQHLKTHDERQTRSAPLRKIFTPDLFAKRKYDEARELWIVAGGSKRYRVAVSGLDQFGAQFLIEDENWKAQQQGRKEQLIVKRLVTDSFKHNPDCENTDALMRKLHGWEPEASS